MGLAPFAAGALLARTVSYALALAATPAATTSTLEPCVPTSDEHATRSALGDDEERNGVTGDLFAAIGGGSLEDEQVGAALRTSFFHPGPTHVGLAVSGSAASSPVKSNSATHGTLNGSMARVGATLGLGAPWDESIVGVALEGGALYGSLTGAANLTTCVRGYCSDEGQPKVLSISYVSPYAELAVTEQLPIRSRVFRPFVREAFSTAVDGNANMQAYLSLSIGFAARVW